MKKNILILAASVLVLTLASCGKQDHSKHAAAQPQLSPDYPLNVCVVSGEKLSGKMGATVVIDYKGQQVAFCCEDCVKDFNKNPEKYIAIINEAKTKKAAEAAK